MPSCTKLIGFGTRNICILCLSTQTFVWLIGIFVIRSRDIVWDAGQGKLYHLILYTSSSNRCCQPYEVLQCNTNICDGYAKATFNTESCVFVPTFYSFTFTEKAHLPPSDLWKNGTKALNDSKKICLRKIFLKEQQIKYWNWSVHLFWCYATGIASFRNTKSVRELVMFQNDK